MKSFWAAKALSVAAQEVKRSHEEDRSKDKRLRWTVRKNVRDDGVTSNLFPITITNNGAPNLIYRYDLEVSRKVRLAQPGDIQPARTTGTVSPNRAWKVFAQALRKYPSLPPLVRVGSRIYSTEPIPKDLLELPKEFLDLGWEKCRLGLLDRVEMHTLSPQELKQLLNKMLPWALAYHAKNDGSFSVVREVDGKMVCTEDGMSVSGLRIFRGTTAAVLQINTNTEDTAQAATAPTDQHIPKSTILGSIKIPAETQKGLHLETPIPLRCLKLNKEFEYKGNPVQSYYCADSSGTILVTLWGYPKGKLTPNRTYIFTGLKAQVTAARYQRADFTYELHGVAGLCQIKEDAEAESATGQAEESHTGPSESNLVLRLDTRCTIASERSMWEEIKLHFGPGPYDEDKQRRIVRAVQGTPVVLSTSLRHTQVRSIRFNVNSPDDVPLEPHLQELSSEFEPHQPYAVLIDFSVVPLQVLHCCFDPKMRSWQDVTVPACSFFPVRRTHVLNKFRAALEAGLQAWKVQLNPDPWNTKRMTLLPDPTKLPPNERGKTEGMPQSSRPSLVVVVAICSPRVAAEDRERCLKTAQSLAKYFRTPHMMEVTKEEEALKFAVETLMGPGGRLKDPNSAVIYVAPEKETRPVRWLTAESLKRGILPLIIRGVVSEKRQKLLNGNVGLQMVSKFALNPIKDYNIYKEVPAVAGKNILVIGIDACHTHDITTGACVGLLITPQGACWFPAFWRNDIRGQEVEQVAENFGQVIHRALKACGNQLSECIVFQDGNVFSELDSMKAHVPSNCGLSFLCLHKRTHIRFVHKGKTADFGNVIKGSVVQALTPVSLGARPVAPSFYLQSHECNMSTARTVQFTVHHISPTIELPQLHQLCYVLSHCASPMATKLPVSTRAAHRMASIVERLVDACPDFRSEMIPEPLSSRSWFL